MTDGVVFPLLLETAPLGFKEMYFFVAEE